MSITKQHRGQSANDGSRRLGNIIGRTKLLAGLASLVAMNASSQSGTVTLSWQPSADASVAGYYLYYGEASRDYTSNMSTGTNLMAMVSGLTPGVTYYFASTAYYTNGEESAFSNEVTNTVPETLRGITSPSILTQPQSQTVVAAGAASFSCAVSGSAPLSLQWYFGTTALTGATNSTLAWAAVAASNAGNYYFTVSNSVGAVTSSVATLTVITPPSILTEPQSQTVTATNAASFSSTVNGSAPMSLQWYFGTTALAGATNNALAWASVAASNAGNYRFTASNAAGAVTSSVATLTVITPPSILTQPQSQTVIATTAAAFSSAETGSAPLSIQWYFGTKAIAGATNSALAWTRVEASNAGNYDFTVSNAGGAVTSSVATLKVLPTNTIATVAGAYNGLFYQTNANGTPDITEATAGFLGNCTVASSGAYSAKVYLDGQSCSLAGAFNISGYASASVSLPSAGLSNLTVDLQLDLFNGSQEITGAVSSTNTGSAWSAPLLGYLATNACPLVTGVNLLLAPGSSTNAPTKSGAGTGLVVNGVLSLAGALGDTAAFAQAVPISTGGNVPLYVNLYTNGGLLAGWINLAGSNLVGNLTWIRPSGVLAPAGFPQGFDTVVQVGGATYNWSTLVTGQTLGTLRYNYTGPVGCGFTCASNSTCRALGRFVVSGNTQTHVVALCSPSFTVLAYATVTSSGATPGTYAYANLATPYPLTAGVVYYILSQETSGGDKWYDYDTTATATSEASYPLGWCYAAGTLPDALSGCVGSGIGAGNVFGPVNMQYTIP
jgi:hypothetical protein